VATVAAALNPAELAAWIAFIQAASRGLQQLDRELLAAHDLSLADYEILVFLSEADEHRLPMSELATRALVSKSRLTYRVDRLVERGLVERRRCEADARRVWAMITDAGVEALTDAWATHVDGVRRYVVGPISPTDLDAVQRAMEAMVAALDADDREPL